MTYHLSPEFVRAVGWGLLHFVWQGAAVAALLALLMAFCRKASVRYVASVLALLLMLALPIITFFVLEQPTVDTLSASSTTPLLTPVTSSWGPANGRHSTPVTPSDAEPEAIFWLVRLWMIGVVMFSLRSAGGFLLVQRVPQGREHPGDGRASATLSACAESDGH